MSDVSKGKEWKKCTRREFIGGALAVGVGTMIPLGAGRALAAMAPVPLGAEAVVPRLKMRGAGGFKILQITDNHLHFIAKGYLGEPQKIKDIQAMVEKFDPDIIVNTGDFWANVSGEGGADTCKWLCKEFAKFKTPWAFAWGNHDESTDYKHTHDLLEKAPYSLYRGGVADGNYRIEVGGADSSEPVWNLIILNNSRGGFKQEQIDWFRSESDRIRKQTPAPPPAFLFFHIPLPQYEDIAASGAAKGVKFENACHEGASRDAFPVFRDAGFVRAMFCGHDHVNDYYGELDGVRLQYGRALGGYGKEKVRKGGTLISVDTVRGTYETKSVFPDGATVTYDTFIVQPEPGRIY